MPKITYVAPDGERFTVDAPIGSNLMDAAKRGRVPGITGDCGGACACATCHIILPEEWYAKFKTPNSMEESMLDFAPKRYATSRLGCQLTVEAFMDGMEVKVPESQY